ncbi:MAG: branched-chain amino acid ABC transporter substrate-binding protein [Azovibrio sp.]|nr:branched-chain amino acid ABC transporter substrate-binding protein [Azovibrio sp.]
MKTSRFPGLMLALAASVALIGCGKEEPPPPPPAPAPVTPPPKPEITVNLGHVAPMTGPQAHLGKDNENGALLAVEDLNAQKLEIGGAIVTFKLLSEDDQADPKQGTVVAQKLVDAKVNGVIGHLNSGTTIPASKIYFDAGIPQVSGASTNPTYTLQGFNTAFRVFANDVQQGKALGEFAAKQGVKKVAIIDDRTAYGQGLADEFRKAAEAAGIKVVASEYTTDKATDFKAILTKIKAKKPDLVFYGGMDAQAGPMVKQMQELGLKTRFLTGDGGCTPEFIKLAGDASEGQFCSLPGLPVDKMPKGPDFKARYTAKYNQEIQLYAPYIYDAVMVVADAMKRANSVEPAKYLAELPKTKYEGVTATIEFDEKGDLKDGAISLYQVKGGKWEYLETLGAAPAPEAAPPADAAPAAADAAPAAPTPAAPPVPPAAPASAAK